MAAHAFLSPSSASIFMECTPAPHFSKDYPNTSGDAAQEGTVAHELSEVLLRQALNITSKKKVKSELAKIEKSKYYNDDMYEYCTEYRDFVLEQYSEALAEDPETEIMIERKFDLAFWMPESFGTGDVSIVNRRKARFIDLKYGRGVRVECDGNKQMRIYALGVYDEFYMSYGFQDIEMTIYQPRISNISTVSMAVNDLLEWGYTELIPKAKLAFEGLGEFKPGTHCKFCRGKVRCKAAADYTLELDRHGYFLANRLTDEAVTDALTKGEILADWVKSVKAYVLSEMLAGRSWPGFKLAVGRSQRRYTDEEAVAAKALEAGLSETDIYNKKIIGIGKMETLLGKDKFSFISDLIEKPLGAPTIVPDESARPAYKSASADFEEDM